jgi:hypothetical protein
MLRSEGPEEPIVLEKIKEMTDRYRTYMPAGDAKSYWASWSEIDQLLNDNFDHAKFFIVIAFFLIYYTTRRSKAL